MDRVILHCDANSFYASCELVYEPSLCGRPVAVCGSTEERHGIVLAATPEAKKRGVKTAMVNWEARQACPDLIMLPPDYRRYISFSQKLRAIYDQYASRVEAFGLDECWLDVSNPGFTWADGAKLALTLRQRAVNELGLTLSVGVSWNKPYAKLGSDMKKPNATTLITPTNYQEQIFNLSADKLIGIGRRTYPKLIKRGINTIGDLARCEPEYMHRWLGKIGLILQCYAAGEDRTPVMPSTASRAVKSVGNSMTAPRDLVNMRDVHCMLYVLAESVGSRLREIGLRGKCLSLSVRDENLRSTGCQKTVPFFTAQPDDMVAIAEELFRKQNYQQYFPLRSIGISMSTLEPDSNPVQMDLMGDAEKRARWEDALKAIDTVRARFGENIISRGIILADVQLGAVNPKVEHTIHPVGFLNT